MTARSRPSHRFYDRTIDGFGELFRAKSLAEIGTAAMLSRASAGLVGQGRGLLHPRFHRRSTARARGSDPPRGRPYPDSRESVISGTRRAARPARARARAADPRRRPRAPPAVTPKRSQSRCRWAGERSPGSGSNRTSPRSRVQARSSDGSTATQHRFSPSWSPKVSPIRVWRDPAA